MIINNQINKLNKNNKKTINYFIKSNFNFWKKIIINY